MITLDLLPELLPWLANIHPDSNDRSHQKVISTITDIRLGTTDMCLLQIITKGMLSANLVMHVFVIIGRDILTVLHKYLAHFAKWISLSSGF